MDADPKTIRALFELLKSDSSCQTFTSRGFPKLDRPGFVLPEDLAEFYKLTAGAKLFYDNSPFGYYILPPEEVCYANPKLLTALYEEDKLRYDQEPSSSLYLLAHSSAGDVTISLAKNEPNFGFCFDSSGSYHATEESIVIAKSFTEFLTLIYQIKGQTIPWDDLDPKYGCLGDV